VSSGVITNCILTGNSGGGANGGTLYNCTLSGNAGAGATGATLYNCVLTGNVGGGASDSTLYNCALTGNSGGGANRSTLYNCTLTWNSDGGANGGTLYNCIVYFNQGFNWQDATLAYSCATPLPPGAGNLSADPQLASPWQLSDTSPCLGAGNPAWATGRDLGGEPWAEPPAMGADQVWPGQTVGPLTIEITAEFAEVAPGFPVSFTMRSVGSILRSVWDFGDGTVVSHEPYTSHAWNLPGAYAVKLTGYNDSHPEGVMATVTVTVTEALAYVDAASANPVAPYSSWETAARNIRDAVNASSVPGRTVLVTDGVYQTGTMTAEGANRVALTNVRLRSLNGPDVTIIDGANTVRCAYVGKNAILSGLTLRNGSEGGLLAVTSGLVTNCVLSGNSGSGVTGGTLYDCTLSGNAGAGATGATLFNCVLTGNAGGGANDGRLHNCTVTGNAGGGANGSTLHNCAVTGNTGGGANGCALYNCTVTGNAGGGATGGSLYNCIVYFNQDRNWADATLEYSCTTPLPPGPGNIAADPQLASSTHLSAASPCLAAGSAAWAKGADLDGEPWAEPPAMGADQVWPAASTGDLTVQTTASFTEVVAGFPVQFTADNRGPILRSVWDFGDGTVAANQPFTSHAWTAPGTYTVRLTGYNDSHPEGVATSTQIQVVEAVHYVNGANSTPVFPYTSWATAATSIEEAANAGTAGGRLILVTDGVYQAGMVEADGLNRVAVTNVVLQSVNGPEATIIDGAEVDGAEGVRCVYLGANAVLSGFTVRNGAGGGVLAASSGIVTNCVVTSNGGGGVSGGTLYNCTLSGNSGSGASGATLYDCVLTGNSASRGGGAYRSTLYNCTLSGNSAFLGWMTPSGEGGAVYDCKLYNCTLTGNSAAYGGGAHGGTLLNCVLTGNKAQSCSVGWFGGRVCSGEGGAAANSTLYNCTLTGNSALYRGGGASGGTLYNCTVTGNSGGGVIGGTAHNCVVYFNLGGNWTDASFSYSCTTPLPPGLGNTSADPQLASASHLAATSPCLGAGNPAWATGVDIDGEPWADPPAMGADQVWPAQAVGPLTLQVTAEFSEVVPGFAVSFTMHGAGAILRSVWDFGDGWLVANQPYTSHAWRTPGEFTVRLTGYNDTYPDGVTTTIPIAVIQAVHYVNVANATPVFPYTTWATAATTLQDAVNASAVIGRLVLVTNGVYQTGTAEAGGGSNRVAMTNMVLRSLNGPGPTIIDGGGTVRCAYLSTNAILDGFTLRNGRAPNGYGGASQGGTLYNCLLTGNSAGDYGGGAYRSTLHGCVLTNNSAYRAAAAYASTLYNCILTGNRAEQEAGGAGASTLYNCTLTGNSLTANWAYAGGGAEDSTLYNCIMYFNSTTQGSWNRYHNWTNCTFTCSCTTPLPPGPGNIEADPRFLNAAAGDFRLRPDSPCINAGFNAWARGETDLDGRPRIVGRTVDMGAYEFQTPSSLISYAWLQRYGLPFDGSADTTDPDSDGLNNWQEWRCQTVPTDPLSVLRLLSVSLDITGVTLSWPGVEGVSYFVERSTDLGATPPFTPLGRSLTGMTGANSFTDTNAAVLPGAFYRVGVEE